MLLLLSVEITFYFLPPGNGNKLLQDLLILFILAVLVNEPLIQKVTLHEGLVLGGDLLGRDAIDTESIIPNANQQRSQQNGQIEAVPLLPLGHVSWAGDASGEFVGRVEFLVLDEPTHVLRASLVVVQLQKAQLCRPYGRTDKLIDIALVFGVDEEFAVLVGVVLELLLELDHMLQHQLLLWGVFRIGLAVLRLLPILELAASLQLLVYHWLAVLQYLQKVVLGSVLLYRDLCFHKL